MVDNDRADLQEVPYAALARARASRSLSRAHEAHDVLRELAPILPDLRSTAASALVASVENIQAAPTAIMPDTSALHRMLSRLLGSAASRTSPRTSTGGRNSCPRPSSDLALQSLHAFGGEGGHRRRAVPPVAGRVLLRRGAAHRGAGVAEAGTALLRCADTWSAAAAAGRSDESTVERWRRVNEFTATLPAHEDHATSQMRDGGGRVGDGRPVVVGRTELLGARTERS